MKSEEILNNFLVFRARETWTRNFERMLLQWGEPGYFNIRAMTYDLLRPTGEVIRIEELKTHESSRKVKAFRTNTYKKKTIKTQAKTLLTKDVTSKVLPTKSSKSRRKINGYFRG